MYERWPDRLLWRLDAYNGYRFWPDGTASFFAFDRLDDEQCTATASVPEPVAAWARHLHTHQDLSPVLASDLAEAGITPGDVLLIADIIRP